MVMKSHMNSSVVPCTLVGDGMVGKTSLALAFTNNQTPDENYVATVFDNYAGNVSVHGEQYTISIFDSPGQHDYQSVRAYSYLDSEVIIVCYSVVDRDTLENVRDVWIPETTTQTKRKKPIILIGCQTDIRIPNNESHVTYDEGCNIAKAIGADAFIECSSASMTGISDVFQTVVKVVLKSRKKKSNIFNRLLRR
ncbi:cell division control protein 42 homolog [Dreissena polymorpha]|uniref:Uncharacterized protein n=1 Tax=Dreissena polymorpha TaxID=45954 RepID=A0A9D4LA75_DREPO|nr:cell division control protein 42 homolog [Dreissena polymorpha]KAH3854335.1 hypothetical protein DPMN_096872 [Dreissena polymorpha]